MLTLFKQKTVFLISYCLMTACLEICKRPHHLFSYLRRESLLIVRSPSPAHTFPSTLSHTLSYPTVPPHRTLTFTSAHFSFHAFSNPFIPNSPSSSYAHLTSAHFFFRTSSNPFIPNSPPLIVRSPSPAHTLPSTPSYPSRQSLVIVRSSSLAKAAF